MRHRLQTRRGRKLYALRKCTVNRCSNDQTRHESPAILLRGLNGARGEWRLVCLAWNMKRMNALGA